MEDKIQKACNLVSSVSEIENSALSKSSTNADFSEWDSFTIIKIALEMEKTFGVAVDDGALEKLISIEGIASLLSGDEGK